MAPILRDEEYRELLLLRTGLRRFLRQSETFARGAGLTPAQHQLLLAIRGHDDAAGPTIGDVAGYLLLRHHSAVELVDRSAAAGLVERREDEHDARAVRLALTALGTAALERLSEENLDELSRLADRFRPLWHDLGDDDGLEQDVHRVRVGHVRDAPPGADAVFVDRLLPRGLSKETAPFSEWMGDVAPSTELCRWYGQREARFEEFARRYRAELDGPQRAPGLAHLVERARAGRLTLLTATREVDRSAAAVLAGVVEERVLAGARSRPDVRSAAQ